MADGEIMLILDDHTRRRLAEAAALAGVSLEDYARGLIAEGLGSEAMDDALAESRRRLAVYDRTGEYISLEEAMSHFDSALEARLARRG